MAYPGGPATNTTTTPTFPLAVSSSGRYLQTASGTPFPIRGDAAYSLIAQLSGSSLTQYLDAMQALGVNAILVELFEHHFSSNAPANALGVAPFSTPEDIRTVQTGYFAHALTVIRAAAARGMVVLLCTAYSGFGGGNEGWYGTAISTRTAGECTTFGGVIGTQLAAEPNIIWVQGGDYDPGTQTNINAIMNGILAQSPASTLCTYHTAPYGDSRSVSGLTNLQINAPYVYDSTGAPSNNSGAPGFLAARAASPTRPFVNYEPRYEGFASSVQWIREQIYGAFLAGGAGSIPGAEPRWHFDAPNGFITTGWVASLTSSMTLCYAYVQSFTSAIRWYDLVPDTGTGLISSARGTAGNDGYITAGRTSDNLHAAVYTSTNASMDLVRSGMAGTFTARWFNPRAGGFTAVTGSPFTNTGTTTITPPSAGDWALLLMVP